MKKQLKRSLVHMCLFTAFFPALVSFSASAQCNPPSSYEDTYPGVGMGIGLTGHTSAYSFGWATTALGTSEFYISAWDDASAIQPAGVAWRLSAMGNPAAIMNQGIIPYSNVRDLEVGSVMVNNVPQLLVAYYLNGVGHMLDVYDMASGAPTFLYTNTLSSMNYYTRISMDCHKGYGILIAWEDMNGINFVSGLNTAPLSFSGIHTLSGTNNETTVDVAFTCGNGLLLQFVYYNPNNGVITQSSFDYWTSMGMTTPQFVSPKIHDYNLVGTCRPCSEKDIPKDIPIIPNCPYMNLDAPGHYQYENWAYTYTTDNNNISVRLLDLPSSPFASTVVVNNGSSLPSMPINGSSNVHPFCQYDVLCGPAINVAWYTNATDPCSAVTAGYYGLRMDATGTSLLSPPDYLTIANNPTWGSMTPVLSMSKSDDIASNFMYTIFPEFDPGAAGFRMENKFPGYCNNSYKGVPDGEEHHHVIACKDAQKMAEFKKLRGISDVSAYPNPFKISFRIGVPNEYANEKATVILIDALGNTIAEYRGTTNEANTYFETTTRSLPVGSYFLNVNVEGKLKETIKLTKSE